MLAPLPGLAVGAATNGVARSGSVSMFCIRHRMDLGPLSYTGSRIGQRRVTLENPSQTACLLAQALTSLVWLVPGDGAYERSVVWPCPPILALPRLEAARFATLPGRLHTPESKGHPAIARQAHASVEYLR